MNPSDLAGEIDNYLQRLFPINRSLTGEGNRQTLRILQEIAPIEIIEYPSGTQVYDWRIPDEWAIFDGYIKGRNGRRLVDFKKSNLHVVGYSEPVHKTMTFDELAPKLHKMDGSKDWIPYRTSYYTRDWGFCVTDSQFKELQASGGLLEVCIDSQFNADGSMTVGQLCIPGANNEEYLVSTYCCHPSMANDNLSGLIVTTLLARKLLAGDKPNRNWRFLFVPETIGAIAYLSHNEQVMKNLAGGLVVTTCGGPGPFGYKETFLGNHLVDRAIRLAFGEHGIASVHYPFVPDGSDERQFSSPGFRIPVATITRDKYYEYPEYHTSADNLDFVTGSQIAQTLDIYEHVVNILDRNLCYRSTLSHGEPQLGRRALYPLTGGSIKQKSASDDAEQAEKVLDAITWLLFLADGQHDLVAMAERSGMPFSKLLEVAETLVSHQLLKPVSS